MLQSELDNFSDLIVLQQEIKNQLEAIDKKITSLNVAYASAKYQKRKAAIKSALEELNRHKEAEADLLIRYEEITARVGREIAEKSELLSPYEEFILRKHYLEGLKWDEITALTQRKPEYVNFIYEKSAMMRARRSAVKKLSGSGCLAAIEVNAKESKKDCVEKKLQNGFRCKLSKEGSGDKETPAPVLRCDIVGKKLIDFVCPNCGGIINQYLRQLLDRRDSNISYKPKYHDECGQRLDWDNPLRLEVSDDG